MEQKENDLIENLDKLEALLNTAHGCIVVNINGLKTDVKGPCNTAGVILAAFNGLKILEDKSGKDFEEIIRLKNSMQAVMGRKKL